MSEEEKDVETIIDEIETENDVTIEKIETEDDVREAFEINKEDGPLAALGAPLIKAAGDPDPADPNMIQKHLDNFLAKIAGETPIDENVRDSTEYWLNRIATEYEHLAGKHLYKHTISAYHSTNKSAITFNVFTESATLIDSLPALTNVLSNYSNGFLISTSGAIRYNNIWWLSYVIRKTSNIYFEFFGVNMTNPDGYVQYVSGEFSQILTSCNDSVEQLF